MPVSNLACADISGVPYDQWNLAVGATKVAAVASNDGDTTYLNSGASNTRQCFNLSWPTDIGTVNSLVANAYMKYATDPAWQAGVGVRNSAGEDTSTTSLTSSYALYSRTCSKPGGGSWSAADCASGVTWIQIRNYTSPGGGHVRCTYVYLTLDYTQPAGCFIPIWSFLLPFLGAGIELANLPALARVLRCREVRPGIRTWFRPDEYAEALRVYREWRRPAFAFLGA